MFIAESISECHSYLDQTDWESKQETAYSSVYLLVESDGYKGPAYFIRCDELWLGFSCTLTKIKCDDEQLRHIVRNIFDGMEPIEVMRYTQSMCRDGYFYQIKRFYQPLRMTDRMIFHQTMSESESLDWLLMNGST